MLILNSYEIDLDESTRDKFKDLLDSQIAGLLSRIEEEDILSIDSESVLKNNIIFHNC